MASFYRGGRSRPEPVNCGAAPDVTNLMTHEIPSD